VLLAGINSALFLGEVFSQVRQEGTTSAVAGHAALQLG
jgi:hypothetical protein